MPISYTVQPHRSTALVRVTMAGVITADALVTHLLQLCEQRLFGLPELVDMRAAQLRWSDEEMRWIAHLIAVLRRRYGPAAVSIVADEEATFDLLVQYLLLAGETDPGLGVFRDLHQAEEWVHDREFSSPLSDWASGSGWRALDPDRITPGRPRAAPPRLLGYARVHRGVARRAFGLDPTRWYPVTEQPTDVVATPLEGYAWLSDAGQLRRVPLPLLEVMWGATSPPTDPGA